MEKVEDREWRSEKEAVSVRQGVEKDGRPVGEGIRRRHKDSHR